MERVGTAEKGHTRQRERQDKGKQHRLSEEIQTTPGAGRCAAGDEGGGQTEEAPRVLGSQSPDAGSLGDR